MSANRETPAAVPRCAYILGMPIETYQEALDFWYDRVNYERGLPEDPRELKLDRMRTLLDRLGRPDQRLRIVHVAGSKGKGSTAAMLAAIFRRAGYHTGLFTSLHLCRVEERCQIDGRCLPADELTALMRELEPVVSRMEVGDGTPPTFFELVTALGFLHFARRRVELAVVEVGLGGRFDSTNVCTPLVSVITSISLDHTQQLGPTVAAIAREKAGIIKPGRPVVSGATMPAARAVIADVARSAGAPLHQLGVDFHYRYRPGRVTRQAIEPGRVTVFTPRQKWGDLGDLGELKLSLLGEHQAANAAVAVATVEQLQGSGLHIADQAVRQGLSQTDWPARLEVVGRAPWIVLDCAHNVASVHALVDTLAASFPPGRRLLVFACSRDKDLAGMLRVLAADFERAWFTRYTSSPRGAAAEELAAIWSQVGGRAAEVCPTPHDALTAARQAAGADDLIAISGSVFLAGELRPALI